MILFDCRLYGQTGRFHLEIRRGQIRTITTDRRQLESIKTEKRLELNGAWVLPGFINSHDHLDFNNFPPSAHGIYPGYREWAADIQQKDGELFRRIQQIPLKLRVAWGQYKNLLNGFTTVVNHGEKLAVRKELPEVFQKCYSLHSVAFENDWARQLQKASGKQKPVVIHAGEGTTAAYQHEIDELLLQKPNAVKLVAVHGVMMSMEQAAAFAALVWCPASNYFLLGKTASVEKLGTMVPVVFGTDSTLSSPWNAWEHFRTGLKDGMVSESELLQMLTDRPAGIWSMSRKGIIEEGAQADLLVIPFAETVFNHNPEDILLVVQDGEIRLIDNSLQEQLKKSALKSFTLIYTKDKKQWVTGKLQQLCGKIRDYYPDYHFPFTF